MGRDTFQVVYMFAISHFNPLSPHGERLLGLTLAGSVRVISIHSPRMGRDDSVGEIRRVMAIFQSTLPAWGETRVWVKPLVTFTISIHSPRMGRDFERKYKYAGYQISIHSPRMGRDSKRTQLFEEKNWRICTTLYLFASKGVLPADKKTF